MCLHPPPHRCRMPHIWLLVWHKEVCQLGVSSSCFTSGYPCIFQRMLVDSASGHCFELSLSLPCQVTVLSNTLWDSSSSIQQGSYDGSPVSELALHPHHQRWPHLSAQLHCHHWDPPSHSPAASKAGPALLSWYFHPETVFLPGRGWAADEWCKTAMNSQASADWIRAGTWSRTCRSASPVVQRGRCSMTGTKPFLYAGCVLPAAPGAFASLRTRE